MKRIRAIGFLIGFFAVTLFIAGASAVPEKDGKFKYEIKAPANTSKVELTGTIDYGLMLTPGYMLKQYLQLWVNEELKCDTPGNFTCAEYPVGRIVGDNKFLMKQNEETKAWEHMARFPFNDQAGPKVAEFPIEISRAFPTYNVTTFKLLDPATPGKFNNEFTISPKSFGDSLIKLEPETNRLYATLCQVFPGTSVLNKAFQVSYTYLPFLNLALTLSGRLGGIQLDGLRICSLVKVELLNDNKVLTTAIDVLPPITYNLERVPLDVHVHSSSWLALVIILLVLGVLFALIPVMLVKLFAILLIVLAALIAILGLLSSGIITSVGNLWVDQQIKGYLGMPLSEFNNEVWIRKVQYDSNREFFEGIDKGETGSFKDGSWAQKFLTEGLIKDQYLIAHASATVSFEKYFAQFDMEKEKLRRSCLSVINVLNGPRLPPQFQIMLNQLRSEITVVCNSINDVNIKSEFFTPRPNSKAAGCYDAFIRLEDVKGRNDELIAYLIDRISKGAGEYRPQVLKALNERISAKVDFIKITNWWADIERPSYCGFDNKITIQLPKIPHSKLAACLISEVTAHPKADTDLMNNFLKNCADEIAGLIDIEDLMKQIGGKEQVLEWIRQAERALPELREKAGPIWKELEPEIENVIMRLKARAAAGG